MRSLGKVIKPTRSSCVHWRSKFTAERMSHLPTTSVWSEFTPLANKHKAVNLGQGFPDFPAEKFVLESTVKAIENNIVQYARVQGHLRLVNALSATYSPRLNKVIDPLTEILITPGAQGALFIACQAFLNPRDEVILIEPFYDSYPYCVLVTGAVPVTIPLRYDQSSWNSAKNWKLDFSELRKKITKKTKMIILNNPQNCPGKVYSNEELQEIANIAIEHDLLVLNDGVYEWMIYDNANFKYIATLPGMYNRTITIGSAGKSFSVTGYKIGWCMAPPEILEPMIKTIQIIPFCVSTPLQEGVAGALEIAEKNNYWKNLNEMFNQKREKLCKILSDVGLNPVVPQGSYFALGNFENIPEKYFMTDTTTPKDYQFCRWLTKTIGVAAIPPSAFYTEQNRHLGNKFARFAFCKRDDVMDAAAERLQKLKELTN